MRRSIVNMVNSFILYISLVLLCASIVASATDNEIVNTIRKEKSLGLSGYISGSSNGFGFIPFWKQWTALLQINIEKNKHKHDGTYLIPTPIFYYYPKDFNSLQYPQEFHNGISSSGFRPLPLLFDDYKTSSTTPSASSGDVLKIAFPGNVNSYDTNLPNSIAKVNEDRRSHKRNALNQNSDEVIATVVEVTENTGEITCEATTQSTEASTTDSTDLSSYESTTNEPDAPITSSMTQQNVGIEPTVNYYTGGSPNANANYIYFTTMYPESQSNDLDNSISRINSNEFKPSIRYEYQNYPYDVDNHFIPIVGIKKIF